MSGTLYFDRHSVEEEIAKVKRAAAHSPIYGEDKGPGLLLVGDHGVYLMGNHADRDPKAEKPVYAMGANPNTDADFYYVKSRIFGGDDGADHLPVDWIEQWLERNAGKSNLALKLTPTKMELL